MSGPILVTGATGNQGGAVVRALLELSKPPLILAATRSTSSDKAQQLATKSPLIKLVQGDLDNVPGLLENAKRIAEQPIWGVYSVQVAQGMGGSNETQQGKALIDESLSRGVKHFVYSSVERGGDEKGWTNPTNVPHFITKHGVELHLRDKAKGSAMGWTILRPVAFMDNISPGFQSRVFLAALNATFPPGKSLQWIAARDIGILAAKAFEDPKEYKGKAIGLAGDETTVEELSEAFKATTGTALTPTFNVLGHVLRYFVAELRIMIDWFAKEGYGVNIPAVKKIHPGLLDLKTWIVEESKFKKAG